MDYISIVSEINQYKHWGVRYFFDYVVKSSGWAGGRQNLARGIEIIPERKYGYVKIRTRDTLPSAELFQDIDIIARRIKYTVVDTGVRRVSVDQISAGVGNLKPPLTTWKPKAAGILDLLCVFGALNAALLEFVQGASPGVVTPIILFDLGGLVILPLIAGICSIKRKIWLLALIGSIPAIVGLVGIPAIVFIAQSKKEFNSEC